MSRFLDITRGTLALKVVDLPLAGAETVKVAVRPLNGAELGRVISDACAYALTEKRRAFPDDARPLPEPKEGDRLYDLGHMVSTLVLACEDPEKPGTPFFASKGEILDGLDSDRIALLYEEQQAWQDRCSPRVDRMDREEFFKLVLSLSQEDEGQPDSPFARLRPSLRLSWARTIARLYLGSLAPR